MYKEKRRYGVAAGGWGSGADSALHPSIRNRQEEETTKDLRIDFMEYEKPSDQYSQ